MIFSGHSKLNRGCPYSVCENKRYGHLIKFSHIQVILILVFTHTKVNTVNYLYYKRSFIENLKFFVIIGQIQIKFRIFDILQQTKQKYSIFVDI